MKKSTLFLNQLSQIDYAYLDAYNSFAPIGGSYHLSVTVTGFVEDHEQVVVDFGKIKKSIKDLVDHRQTGYDHKLWIPNAVLDNDKIKIGRKPNDVIEIEYNIYKITCPANSIRFITSEISHDIELYLEEELEKIYGQKLDVVVTLTDSFVINQRRSESNLFEFRYIHGLKNSSSWGCQNLNHGHKSFIGVTNENDEFMFIPSAFYKRLSDKMKKCIFIHRDNLMQWDGSGITTGYECERGYFEAKYPTTANIIITEEETTIENLVDWFYDLYKSELEEMKAEGAKKLFISEGLAKGSAIIL